MGWVLASSSTRGANSSWKHSKKPPTFKNISGALPHRINPPNLVCASVQAVALRIRPLLFYFQPGPRGTGGVTSPTTLQWTQLKVDQPKSLLWWAKLLKTKLRCENKWKSLRLDLLEVDRNDRTNSLRTPRMKESQLLREKTTSSVFVSTCSNAVHAQFHWLAYTRNTRPCDVVCLQSKHFRSLAGILLAPRAKIYARSTAIEVKHETLPANRTRLLAAPVDLLPILAVDLLACSGRRHCSPTRDGHQPVMTGHNARRPRTGRERRPWWWPSEASYLTVWTLNDRFFASLVHCILRRLLSEYWRKETEKSKVFCGVVGLDGRCSAQAEQRKKPVAVVHLPGAYLSTETNLVPIRGVIKRSLIPDTQTGTHTHTHTEWKSLRLDLLEVDRMTALFTTNANDERKSTSSRKNHFLGLSFNMFKRCACPVSLTCIHTQHQAMWRLLFAVETLPIDRWHDRATGEDLRARSIAIEVKHESWNTSGKR